MSESYGLRERIEALDWYPSTFDAITDGTAMLRRDAVLLALDLATTGQREGDQTCSYCGGQGWYATADPLPSGEPDEPYQVQCGECNGSGVIAQPEVRAADPGGLREDARAAVERYFNAEDSGDDAAVYVAMTHLRRHWTWFGGAITGDAALTPEATAPGHTPAGGPHDPEDSDCKCLRCWEDANEDGATPEATAPDAAMTLEPLHFDGVICMGLACNNREHWPDATRTSDPGGLREAAWSSLHRTADQSHWDAHEAINATFAAIRALTPEATAVCDCGHALHADHCTAWVPQTVRGCACSLTPEATAPDA